MLADLFSTFQFTSADFVKGIAFVLACGVIAGILLRGKRDLLQGLVSKEELDSRLRKLDEHITEKLKAELVSQKDLEIARQSFLLAIHESAEKNRHATRAELQAVILRTDELKDVVHDCLAQMGAVKTHLQFIKPMPAA